MNDFLNLHFDSESGKYLAKGSNRVSYGNKTKEALNDGVFLSWEWDGSNLQINSDSYGAYPAFYSLDKRNFCIATTLHGLSASTNTLNFDLPALSLYLKFGYFIGGRTPFKEIQKIRPHRKLVIREGKYIAVDCGVEPPKLSDNVNSASARSEFISRFSYAMEKRLSLVSQEFSHPLSGGRDSRHILLEMYRQKRLPAKTFTVRLSKPDDPLGDEAVARQLSEVCGVQHSTLLFPKFSAHSAELVKNFCCGLTGSEGAWMTASLPLLAQYPCAIFDGIGGDVLAAGLFIRNNWQSLAQEGRWDELAVTLVRDLSSNRDQKRVNRLASKIFGVPETAFSEEAAIECVRDELDLYKNFHNPVTAFFFYNRTAGVIAASSFGMYQCVDQIHAPFLDRNVAGFLLSLPESMFADHQFHSRAIAEAYPDFATIPYTGKKNVSPIVDTHVAKFKAALDLISYTGRQLPSKFLEVIYWLVDCNFKKNKRTLTRHSLVVLLETLRLSKGDPAAYNNALQDKYFKFYE
ncbi:MAG: hypothetical protein LAT55_08250 [Opitutales bacterium]|nr:hypothetical protein [Opitutales bacterium]